MFYGWFKPTTNKKARYKTMWFCLDNKDRCVLGDVQDSVKAKPKVTNVSPIFTYKKLTHIEMA